MFTHHQLPVGPQCASCCKNVDGGVFQSVVGEDLNSVQICVQGVTPMRNGRREQDPDKNRLPTIHFIVSVALGPDVTKVRSLSELFGFRVSVESYVAANSHYNSSAASFYYTYSLTADANTGASRVAAPTSPVDTLPRTNRLSAVAARETIRRTTVTV